MSHVIRGPNFKAVAMAEAPRKLRSWLQPRDNHMCAFELAAAISDSDHALDFSPIAPPFC